MKTTSVQSRNLTNSELNNNEINYHLKAIQDIVNRGGKGLQVDLVISQRNTINKSNIKRWAIVSPVNRINLIPIAYRLIMRDVSKWEETILDSNIYYTFDASNKRFYCDKNKQLIMVYSLLPGYLVKKDGALSETIYKIDRKLFDVRK
jgi:hypothetical protein